MAQRVLVNMLLLSTKPPHIETPRAEIRMVLLSMEAHSAPRAASRGEQTLAPEPFTYGAYGYSIALFGKDFCNGDFGPTAICFGFLALDMPVQALPSSGRRLSVWAPLDHCLRPLYRLVCMSFL